MVRSVMMSRESKNGTDHHFAALDSLRGVCAVIVVIFHFPLSGILNRLAVVQNGWIFVDFFFVLSGFVIAYACSPRLADGRDTVRGFMIARVARIYPLHLFMLALLIGMEVLRIATGIGGTTRAPFEGSRSVEAIFANLMLLHSTGILTENSWNGVSWSISAEMGAYLLFGVVFATVPRHGTIIFLLAGSISLALLLALSPDGLDTTYDYGYLRGLLGFSLGVGMHTAFRSGLRIGGTTAEVLVVVAVIFVTGHLDTGRATFLALPVFALAVLTFASERGAVSRILKARPFQFFGRISYSIYMTHALTHIVAFEMLKRIGPRYGFAFWPNGRVSGPVIASDLITIAMLCCVIAIATLSFRFIEIPARNRLRNRTNRMIGGTPSSGVRAVRE